MRHWTAGSTPVRLRGSLALTAGRTPGGRNWPHSLRWLVVRVRLLLGAALNLLARHRCAALRDQHIWDEFGHGGYCDTETPQRRADVATRLGRGPRQL